MKFCQVLIKESLLFWHFSIVFSYSLYWYSCSYIKIPKLIEILLFPGDEFFIYKNDKKTYFDSKGKIKQDINYTLIPKKNIETNKLKVILLSIALGVFLISCFLLMMFAYKMDIWKAAFEFANNYLFVGAITLFVFLVFNLNLGLTPKMGC